MTDDFSAAVDHASGIVRLRCEPCNKTGIVRLDDAGFTDLVGNFAAEHRTCGKPAEEAPPTATAPVPLAAAAPQTASC